MNRDFDTLRPENLVARLRAFLDHGYEQMTMSGLAQLCS